MSYQSLPTYDQPFTDGKNTSSVWYRFFQALWTGQPPSSEVKVTVGGNPYAFAAPSRGFVIVSGGTVSSVSFTRSSVYVTGATSGCFPVSKGDVVTVAYTVPPTMTFVPQ